MADLRRLLEEAGYEDVRTLLQSGNVVLSSPLSARKLEAALERELAAGLGIDVQVLVRTRAELAKVVALDPLGKVATNHSRYLVSFLAKKLSPRVAHELGAAGIVVRGRELYAWHPDGVQRSPLGKLLADERLGVVSTARNWNTVTKLLQLLDE
jgi:uncharacterized protein (DUF1697 family)